jgi:hypothetical protein
VKSYSHIDDVGAAVDAILNRVEELLGARNELEIESGTGLPCLVVLVLDRSAIDPHHHRTRDLGRGSRS